MKTVKAFLKTLIVVRDQPISHLRGAGKLTEDEFLIIGNITAVLANEMGEDDFIELLKKFKINRLTI